MPSPSPISHWQRWDPVGRERDGVEVFLSREPAVFHLHWHEEWSLGAILEGRCAFSCAGRRYVARRGDVVLIPPFTAHASETSRDGFSMVMVYLPAGQVSHHLGMGEGWPALATHVWRRPAAARALQEATSRRQLDVVWRVLVEAVAHCRRAGPLVRRRVDPRIAAVCSRLQSQSGWTADLPALAAKVGLSREHFHRLFKRTVGLAPGQYLRLARIEVAKRLLRDGALLVDAAASCGFADQAHFTRWFRRYLGISPGRFAADMAVGRAREPGAGGVAWH